MLKNYYDRMMKSRDPRYHKIAKRLGKPPSDDMAELRAEYEKVFGKRPYMGWDARTLREKIAEAVIEE